MKWWLSLSPLARTVIIIVLAILVIWLFIILKNWIKRLNQQADFKDTVKEAEQQLAESIQQHPLSYPEAIYSGWANQFFTLIDGCDFWTNGPKTLEIFAQINNDSDYLMFISKFGVRTIENCGPFTGNYQADLPTAFKTENLTGLSSSINAMFIKKGMKSRI